MWPFSKKGPSGFSSSSTAEEVTAGVEGSGLTAIVTGASSGIGIETARVLALRGVHVVMAVRNLTAGHAVKEAISKEIPAAKVDVLELDLSSMGSVRKFASEFLSLGLPLNILINNAGIMASPYSLSQDGIELQFATNHMGHFLLTHLLVDKMKATSSESNVEGRIVNVSSEAHKYSHKEGICFDKITDSSSYSAWMSYTQSKLANVLHANELSRCFKEEGVKITANSIHPGIITTNLFKYQGFFLGIAKTIGRVFVKSVQQGAATTCYVALNPRVAGVTGKYFVDGNVAAANPKAADTELANKLWDFSLGLASSYT